MSKESNQLKRPYVTFGIVLIWVGFACLTLVVASLIHDGSLSWNPLSQWHLGADWDLMTKIGGFLGGIITPIWTLINALFIYQTLILQQEATVNQEKAGINQQFESTLMHMLQRQERIKNDVDFDQGDTFVWIKDQFHPENGKTIKGEMFFRESKNTFALWYKEGLWIEHREKFCFNAKILNPSETYLANTPSWEDYKKRILFKGNLFYSYYQIYFDYYFNHLEAIFKLIEKGNEDSIFKVNNEHHPYIKFFKAQLSNSELFHIFYGCLSRYAELRDYVIKYDMLEKLNDKELAGDENHVKNDLL